MKCCILSCKNYSDRRSDAMDGITFHLVPSKENLRQQWITKINRQAWTPTKHTKICSCHFNDEDFKMTKKGRRKLKEGALPCLKLDISVKKEFTEPETSSNDMNEFLVFNDCPRMKKLKQEIAHFRWQSKTDKLKIRRLQMKVNRLEKKIDNFTALVLKLNNLRNNPKPKRIFEGNKLK